MKLTKLLSISTPGLNNQAKYLVLFIFPIKFV